MAIRRKARSRPKKKAAKSVKSRRALPAKRAAREAAKRRTPARRPAARAPRARKPAARPAAARIPSGIGFLTQHMDYTSHDMEGVQRFYTALLGFSDFRRMTDGMDYLAISTGPSSSLGFMPPMPGPPEQWQPPREPTIYLFVSDVDRAHAELVRKGVSFEHAPQDMPWGHRVARLRDPEGRSVCLAEVLRR